MIDADASFYEWLRQTILTTCVSGIRLEISGLSIRLFSGRRFRTYIDNGEYCIELTPQAKDSIAHLLEPFTVLPEAEDGAVSVRGFAFFDVLDGFEVIIRTVAKRPRTVA